MKTLLDHHIYSIVQHLRVGGQKTRAPNLVDI